MWKVPDELMFLANSRKEQKKSIESIKGKICVVTGATSGVGYEGAKELAAGGGNIIIVGRNPTKAEKVKKEIEETYEVSVDYFIADFSDLNQVKKVGEEITEKYPKIDILVNSAGLYSTKKLYTKDGLEMVFCVNHLASFLLTKILLKSMVPWKEGRIIQVNSQGHRFNGLDLTDLNWHKRIYTGLRSYGASKTAQLLTVWQFAEELKGSGITINAIHPGAVKTNIGQNNGKVYRWFLNNVISHFLKDPKIAGQAIYYLATSPELANVTGKFFNLTIEEKPAKHALNKEKQREIWDISLKMTGLKKE